MKRSKFLSSRISDIHSEPAVAGGNSSRPRSAEEEEDAEARRLFRTIKREAEALGISGLDEKERKSVEIKTLCRLGAKPPKRPRVPMAIGVGMVKKAAEREAQQRELSIAEGMAPEKRKRKWERVSRDRGLAASKGVFKHGVLFVKPPSQPKQSKDEEQAKGTHKRRARGPFKRKSKKKPKKSRKH